MKNKTLKVFASLSLLSLIIVGCGETTPSTSASDSNNVPSNSVLPSESTPVTPSTPSESVPVVPSTPSESVPVVPSTPSESVPSSPSISDSSEPVESYKIIVGAQSNCTVELSKTEAFAGEEVTVTVTPESGYIVEKILLNGKPLTSNTFIMPNNSAVIEVYTTLVDKDGFIIDGDVSAKLVEENGIYVARNVVVQNDSYVGYVLDGASEALSVTKLNTYKTFAEIDISGSSKQGGFEIGGNAIYDFFYDPADLAHPCYVQRVGIINLPASEVMVEKLFSGSAMSRTTLNPAGVNNVEYYSSTKNEKYEWDLYSNNSSYAQIVNPVTNKEKAIVYKAQLDEVYKVVDNYNEGAVDPTYITRGDTTSFSGQYDIVGQKTSNKYQYTQEEVNQDANAYSHTMESLDGEFYSAYRNGFVGNIYNDVDVFHGSEVKSTQLENGEFLVELDTWVRWSGSSVYATEYAKSMHIAYDLDITFTKGGAIKTATYNEIRYGEDSFDFTSNQFKVDPETVDPYKTVTVSYGYGEALEGQPNVDVSKYFTQSIENIVVQGKNTTSPDTLSVSEDLNANEITLSDGKSDNMTFTCSPMSALDKWQYGPVASSNNTVIGPKSVSTPYEFRALQSGTADVTIGNHTKNSNSVTASKTITVANSAYIKSFYMYTVYPYNDYDGAFMANYGYVNCGNTYEIQMAGTSTSGNTIMKNLGITGFEYTAGEGILDIKIDDATGKLTIDATNANVAEQTTVRFTVVSTAQVSDWPASSFSIYVLPKQEYSDSIVGTWNAESGSNSVVISNDSEGTINIAGSKPKSYNFTYTYDAATGKIEADLVDGQVDANYVTLDMFIDATDGALCIYFATEVFDYVNYESIITEILGADLGDEYGSDIRYEAFIKQA